MSEVELSIKNKIEKKGIPLKEWNIKINYGVKTGLNDAFIIDENTKQKLIDSDPHSAEIIRPILRGRDIHRCSYDFRELYLINVHNGLKAENTSPIDVNEFSAIKTWLDSFFEKLEKREDKGITPYNLRNCEYLNEFSKPKIIYPDISTDFSFAFDEKGMMINNTAYMITSDNLLNLQTLFVTLQSKLFRWYYSLISVQLGTKAVRMFTQYVLRLPIIKGRSEDFGSLFKELIESKNIETTKKKIDELIDSLYDLTIEEKEYIDKQ